MNARAEILQGSGVVETAAREPVVPEIEDDCKNNTWNPEDFAREQIRGLVRLVFFAGGARPVREVVFSAAEQRLDVASICDQVARSLALETHADVALVDFEPSLAGVRSIRGPGKENAAIKSRSAQMTVNLWRVPKSAVCERGGEEERGHRWSSCLVQLRNEFEYLVIQGPGAGTTSEASLLGQLTDGVVLVLGAHSTRRATARKIKEAIEAARSRILGTVLSERTFPIPESIYRRL
jgi:hypothetical protein